MVSDSGLVVLLKVAVRADFKGGNLDDTHDGDPLCQSPAPVTLCLKSGDFSLACMIFKIMT